MLRRRREYYVGGRPRRRMGPLAVAGLAVLVIGGGTAMAAFVPAMGFAPFGPTTPAAVETDDVLGAQATTPPSTPAATAAQSPAPSIGPLPSVDPGPPAPEVPPPCRPPAHVEAARVVSHGDIHEKVVALTFDDGTNPENTKQILRILVKNKVNATFFPTGKSMERFPEVWKAIARDNYPIANHTYAHIELAGKCFEPQRRELAKARSIFDSLGIEQFPVMRPPYELFDETTEVATAAAGLQAVILWNIDTRDWQGASVASIRASALRGGKGSIVLMHTFPEATAAALPGIIKGYKARGFRFVTIGELLGIAGPIPYPAKR